ncbi:MAG: peptidase MA family metallohydrolase, partial [Longimicrobiales bacterium]
MRARSAFAAVAIAGLMAAGAARSAMPGAAQQLDARRGDVVIRHWPGQARLAQSLLPPESGFSFPGLPADVLQRGNDVIVYLAPDAARFDSLTGGRAPEWGAGVAFPQRGIIIIPGYVSSRAGTHELPRILRHELAHVALQRHLGDALVPRWFTEGYATWTAGQLDVDAGWQLRLALASPRAPTLDSLTLDWPLLASDARIAYLLSASAVQYLYSLGNEGTIDRLFEVWSESGNFEASLREVYVISSPQFERLWRAHVKRRFGWLQMLAQTAFIWVIAAILVIALFVIRRRRDRRRLEELRAAEFERAMRQLGHLSPADRERLEQFSHALLNKFLHQPTRALKEAAEQGHGYG